MKSTIEKELVRAYLKCPKCKEPLIEYHDREEIEGYIIDKFKYFKCPKCGKKYFGYQYETIDDKIKNFKLLERKMNNYLREVNSMNYLEKVIDKSIKKYNNSKISFEVNYDMKLVEDILKILEDRGYMWLNGTLPTKFMPSPYAYSIELNLYPHYDDNSISYSDKKLNVKGLNCVKYKELKETKKKTIRKIEVEEDNISNILILEPYTVVYFTDGDIFVACCDDENEFNEEIGIAICKTKKMIKDEKERLEKLKKEMKFSERRIKFGRDYLREVNE